MAKTNTKNMVKIVNDDLRTYTKREVDNIISNYTYEKAELLDQIAVLREELHKESELADKFRQLKELLRDD
jgi:hypothetical protein